MSQPKSLLKMTTFDLRAYLDRIGIASLADGVEGLKQLQTAHLSHIPFENVLPLLGTVPSLDSKDLQKKIVLNHLGGYCFEMNGLLRMALNELGFRSKTVLARVRNGASIGGPRMHQCFIVEVSGQDWLVDVGFGGPGAISPISLDKLEPQSFTTGTFRVVFDSDSCETVIERNQSGAWVSLFGFDYAPVSSVDLDAANYLAATWSVAPFSTNLMASIHTEKGRSTLFNRSFRKDGRHPEILSSAGELYKTLKEEFKLDLSREYITAIWDKIRNSPLKR